MFQKNRNSEQEILILKNLDIMAYKDKAKFKAQELPSLSQAQIQLQPLLVRDANGKKFSLGCSLQQFKKYGPGVYLVFKFMKSFLIVMGILLPFPLANMIILIKSEHYYDDTNFQTSLEATTFNGENSYNTLMFSFNFVVILLLTLSIMYWKNIQTKLIAQCSNQICLPSYFAVILTDIPNHYTEHQFKEYIEQKYGKIYEIYTAKNYHEDLQKYKLMHQIIEQIKEQRQFYNKNKDKQSCIKLVQLFLRYRALHQLLNDNASNQRLYEPYCAFITFENNLQRENFLSDQQTETSIVSCLKRSNQDSREDRFNPQKIKFKPCQMEPDGVSWQNLNMSTKEMVLRCSLITFLLILFLFISITIIFIFVAAQSGLYLEHKNKQNYHQILSLDTLESLMGHCLELSYRKFHSKPECQQFSSEYNNYFMLFLIFPIVITVLKMIFAYIMKQMVEIRRHKNSFEKVQWQIIILSLFYFIKAGLIKFVIYRKFIIGNTTIELLSVFLPILTKLKHILPIYPERIHIYSSFSGEWVAHTSHKIIVIGIFSFNFTILYHYCHGLIVKKYREYKAIKMLTQHRANQLLKGEQFQIQMIYAEIIALILFCMMYFSCMPIIYILVFISLVLLYWSSKYSLINFCKKPIVYSHGINSLAVKFILYSLMLNCIVSPIYYAELNYSQTTQSLISALTTHWEYLTLLLIILIYLIGGDKLTKFLTTVYKKTRIFFNPRYQNSKSHQSIKEISRGKGKMQSYSMHENQKYNEILQILFIINKIEINKIGYFKHSRIQELKSQINKNEYKYKLFQQLLQDLQEEFSHLSKDKSREKHEKYVQILRKIELEVKKQVADEQKEKQIQVLVKSKIKQVCTNQNLLKDTLDLDYLLKCKSQIKTQLSNDMNLDPAPQTEKRLH